VFLEKQERTLGAVIASPLRFSEYMAAKVALLVLLSVSVALFVVIVAHGFAFDLLPLLTGVALGTVLMLLVDFITSLPFSSISDWFLPAVLPLAVMNLPILGYSGLWEHPLLYLIPTYGPLLLVAAAFDQLTITPAQLGYALAYPVACAAGLGLAANAAFAHFVVGAAGAR
jgi:fluoroquinolone transport system permease protein